MDPDLVNLAPVLNGKSVAAPRCTDCVSEPTDRLSSFSATLRSALTESDVAADSTQPHGDSSLRALPAGNSLPLPGKVLPPGPAAAERPPAPGAAPAVFDSLKVVVPVAAQYAAERQPSSGPHGAEEMLSADARPHQTEARIAPAPVATDADSLGWALQASETALASVNRSSELGTDPPQGLALDRYQFVSERDGMPTLAEPALAADAGTEPVEELPIQVSAERTAAPSEAHYQVQDLQQPLPADNLKALDESAARAIGGRVSATISSAVVGAEHEQLNARRNSGLPARPDGINNAETVSAGEEPLKPVLNAPSGVVKGTLAADPKPATPASAQVRAGMPELQRSGLVTSAEMAATLITGSNRGAVELTAHAVAVEHNVLAPHIAVAPRAGELGGSSLQQAAAIQTPVHDAQWGETFGARLVWMVNHRLESARIYLNPPELGRVNVELSVNGDQASLTIVSQHSVVRDALEAALPRLREALDSNGLTLTNADISGDAGTQQRRQHTLSDSLTDSPKDADAESTPQDADHPPAYAETSLATGLVDIYA